jgi:hypothetical protein
LTELWCQSAPDGDALEGIGTHVQDGCITGALVGNTDQGFDDSASLDFVVVPTYYRFTAMNVGMSQQRQQ